MSQSDAPQRLFIRLKDLTGGMVSATTYPFPDATKYVIAPTPPGDDIPEMQIIRDNTLKVCRALLAVSASAPLSESGDAARNELLRTLKLRCGYIINGYSDAKMEAVEMERLINEHFAAVPSPASSNANSRRRKGKG